MNLEVIVLVKKQRELEKNSIKKKAVYNTLKEKDSLTNKQKNVLKKIDRYLKKLNNNLKKLQNIKIILHMA